MLPPALLVWILSGGALVGTLAASVILLARRGELARTIKRLTGTGIFMVSFSFRVNQDAGYQYSAEASVTRASRKQRIPDTRTPQVFALAPLNSPRTRCGPG